MQRVVVVGAGLAGLRTVAALRERGFTGGLVLVGAEPHLPYDRPPLSKAVLAGEIDDTTLEADWAAWDVDLRLGQEATGLTDGVLTTDRGSLGYDALVVATGAAPLRLPGADAAVTLRTRDDALALRSRLVPGSRLVVVGAGWIGAEVATAAVARGVEVTVVEALDHPLGQALPEEVARRTEPWWSAVDLRLGTSVVGVERDAVHLAGGGSVPADTVLVGVGVRPSTAWLAGSGVQLTTQGAVAVDATLRSSVPGVWAVGDAAAWTSQRYGTRMLVEHWDNALHAPSVVAGNVLGGEVAWDPVPYFWSEQWARMVQYAGHRASADRVVWREDGDCWAACWLAGDRLVAMLTVDRPRDLVQGRRLMAAGRPVDADLLVDPGVPVRSTAR